jgi:hypothetical protein
VDAGLLGRADGAGRYRVSALLRVFATEIRPRTTLLEAAPAPVRPRGDGAPLLHRRALPISAADIDCSSPAILPVNGTHGLTDLRKTRAINDA